MYSKGKPRVSGDPCVTVTTKKFDKPSGVRTKIELRTLRVGQSMMVTAIPGEIVELKILLIPTQSARPAELHLEVSQDSTSLPDARGTHGTLE